MAQEVRKDRQKKCDPERVAQIPPKEDGGVFSHLLAEYAYIIIC